MTTSTEVGIAAMDGPFARSSRMTVDPMRIMLVVNEFPPEKIAGTAMATRALAEHLTARGHQVLVVVTTDCPQAARDRIAPADYQLVWTPRRPFRGVGMAWRIWHAWRAARRFAPQIIQGQAVSCGLIAALLGRLLGVPSICYAQGYDVYQATAWQRRTEIRWGCGWPDCLLAVTEHLAGAIRRSVERPDIRIMPHAFRAADPMPERDCCRRRLGLSDDAKVILAVGRLERFKGHDVLLAAWEKVAPRMGDAKLWIVGSGSQRQALERQVAASALSSSVTLLGALPADAVQERMAASDLFVLPSRSEPFGIVLLEAMAYGLPVIASDVGGVPEVVPADGDARLVASDDAAALAEALLQWYRAQRGLSAINREHAMRLEWRRQVRRFESLYQQFMSARGDAP